MVLCFCALLTGSKAYLCLEGRCVCMKGGLIICEDVVDQSVLDFSDVILEEFQSIVIHNDMDCIDVARLEERTKLNVLNQECASVLEKDIMKSSESRSEESERIGHYIYETITCILVIVSLLISGKNRHNMAPLVMKLPNRYTSNRTFIRNMFKVCIYIYVLYEYIIEYSNE